MNIWIASAITITIVIVYPIYAENRRRRLSRASSTRTIFFQNAMLLLNDKNVPNNVLEFINYLYKNIDNKKLCRALIYEAFTGNLRKYVLHPDKHVYTVIKDINKMSGHQKVNITICVENFVLSLSHFDTVFGSLLKRVVFYSILVDPEHAIRAIGARVPQSSINTDESEESDLRNVAAA